jgi:MarR family
MAGALVPTWSFLTNHARVLLSIAQDPGIRLREIGDSVGITERAAHRIVSELADSGYISRTRDGRRSHYTIQSNMPLPDSLARGQKVGSLLTILGTQARSRSSELKGAK